MRTTPLQTSRSLPVYSSPQASQAAQAAQLHGAAAAHAAQLAQMHGAAAAQAAQAAQAAAAQAAHANMGVALQVTSSPPHSLGVLHSARQCTVRQSSLPRQHQQQSQADPVQTQLMGAYVPRHPTQTVSPVLQHRPSYHAHLQQHSPPPHARTIQHQTSYQPPPLEHLPQEVHVEVKTQPVNRPSFHQHVQQMTQRQGRPSQSEQSQAYHHLEQPQRWQAQGSTSTPVLHQELQHARCIRHSGKECEDQDASMDVGQPPGEAVVMTLEDDPSIRSLSPRDSLPSTICVAVSQGSTTLVRENAEDIAMAVKDAAEELSVDCLGLQQSSSASEKESTRVGDLTVAVEEAVGDALILSPAWSVIEQTSTFPTTPDEGGCDTGATRTVEASKALQTDSVRDLSAALPRAVQQGVNLECVDAAYERRVTLEEQAWNERIQYSAKRALEDALHQDIPGWLDVAADRALENGMLSDSAKVEVAARNSKYEAEVALYAALQESRRVEDARTLAHAIAVAERTGVDSDLLKHANARLGQVEEHVRKRQAAARAEQAIVHMVRSEADAVTLATALESGREALASRETLDTGWKKKVSLERDAWQFRKRELAASRLNDAMRADTGEGLEAAIAYAAAAGVPADLLERARQQTTRSDEQPSVQVRTEPRTLSSPSRAPRGHETPRSARTESSVGKVKEAPPATPAFDGSLRAGVSTATPRSTRCATLDIPAEATRAAAFDISTPCDQEWRSSVATESEIGDDDTRPPESSVATSDACKLTTDTSLSSARRVGDDPSPTRSVLKVSSDDSPFSLRRLSDQTSPALSVPGVGGDASSPDASVQKAGDADMRARSAEKGNDDDLSAILARRLGGVASPARCTQNVGDVASPARLVGGVDDIASPARSASRVGGDGSPARSPMRVANGSQARSGWRAGDVTSPAQTARRDSDDASPAHMPQRGSVAASPIHNAQKVNNEASPARSGWRGSDVASPVSARMLGTNTTTYGLDTELKAKLEAKYDTRGEAEVAQWIEIVTGVELRGELFDALRSGQVLCQLINCIRPGTVAKINNPGMPFKERENISLFLKACRKLGVQEYALFNTDDLYEQNNTLSVVRCLYALGGAVRQSAPDFKGPYIGVADNSNAKREERRKLKATQTGGLQCAMERTHVDMTSGQIVRGGC